MGRPPLPLGTRGKIRMCRLPHGGWRAIANYRDYDGITRPVERVGETKAKAVNNLLQALRDRARRSSDGEIKAESKVSFAADLWFRTIDESDKAARTKQEYGTPGIPTWSMRLGA